MMTLVKKWIIGAGICLAFTLALTVASPGDRSYVYQKCLHACLHANCSEHAIDTFVYVLSYFWIC